MDIIEEIKKGLKGCFHTFHSAWKKIYLNVSCLSSVGSYLSLTDGRIGFVCGGRLPAFNTNQIYVEVCCKQRIISNLTYFKYFFLSCFFKKPSLRPKPDFRDSISFKGLLKILCARSLLFCRHPQQSASKTTSDKTVAGRHLDVCTLLRCGPLLHQLSWRSTGTSFKKELTL